MWWACQARGLVHDAVRRTRELRSEKLVLYVVLTNDSLGPEMSYTKERSDGAEKRREALLSLVWCNNPPQSSRLAVPYYGSLP